MPLLRRGYGIVQRPVSSGRTGRLRLLRRTFANHHERRPGGRMRLLQRALIDERQHGAAQRFGAANVVILCDRASR